MEKLASAVIALGVLHMTYSARYGAAVDQSCTEDRSDRCSRLGPADCYIPFHAGVCCATCLRHKLSSQRGCQYGDRSQTCQGIEPEQCYRPAYIHMCCKSCTEIQITIQGKLGCEFGDRSPHMCRNIRPDHCYSSYQQRLCCESCALFSTGDASCPYGDRNRIISTDQGKFRCEGFVKYFGPANCTDPSFRINCCSTCSQYLKQEIPSPVRTVPRPPAVLPARRPKPSERYKEVTGSKEGVVMRPSIRFKQAPVQVPPPQKYQPAQAFQQANREEPITKDHRIPSKDRAGGQSDGFEDFDESSEKPNRTFKKYASRPSSVNTQMCQSLPDSRVKINEMNCTTAIGSLGKQLCYKYRNYGKSCCEMCQQLKTNTKGCEFGDRSTACRSIRLNECYVGQNKKLCCKTCQKHRKKGRRGCEFGDRNPRSCEIMKLRPYNCYNRKNRHICCKTCEELKTKVPGCKYGDRNVVWRTPEGKFNCDEYVKAYGIDKCKKRKISRHCCKSCAAYNTYGKQLVQQTRQLSNKPNRDSMWFQQ